MAKIGRKQNGRTGATLKGRSKYIGETMKIEQLVTRALACMVSIDHTGFPLIRQMNGTVPQTLESFATEY
jgi:hypothetical protein